MASAHLGLEMRLSTLALEVLLDVAWGPEAIIAVLGEGAATQLWNAQRVKPKLSVAVMEVMSKLQGASNPLPRSLDLRSCATNASSARLRLLPLHSLRARGCIKLTDAYALAQALPMLTSLNLSKCSGMADVTMRRLGCLTSLTRLSVADTNCSSLEWLAPLTALAHLCMARTRINDAALARVPALPALMELDLSATTVSSLAITQYLPPLLPCLLLLDLTGIPALTTPSALAGLSASFQQAATKVSRPITVSLSQRRLILHASHTSAADALASLIAMQQNAERQHEQGMAGGQLGELLEAFVAPAQASSLSTSSSMPLTNFHIATAPPLTATALLLADRLRNLTVSPVTHHLSPTLAPPHHTVISNATVVPPPHLAADATPPIVSLACSPLASPPADPFALPMAIDADLFQPSPRMLPPRCALPEYGGDKSSDCPQSSDGQRGRWKEGRATRWSKVEDAMLAHVAELALKRGWASVTSKFQIHERSATALEARFRFLYQPSPRRAPLLLPHNAKRHTAKPLPVSALPIAKHTYTHTATATRSTIGNVKRGRGRPPLSNRSTCIDRLTPESTSLSVQCSPQPLPACSPVRRLLPDFDDAKQVTVVLAPQVAQMDAQETTSSPECATQLPPLPTILSAPHTPPPRAVSQALPAPSTLGNVNTNSSGTPRMHFVPRTPPPVARVDQPGASLASILAARTRRTVLHGASPSPHVPCVAPAAPLASPLHVHVPPSPTQRISAILTTPQPHSHRQSHAPLRPASVVSPLPALRSPAAPRHLSLAHVSPLPTAHLPLALRHILSGTTQSPPAPTSTRLVAHESPVLEKKSGKTLRVPAVPARLQPRYAKRRATKELAAVVKKRSHRRRNS